MTKFGREVNDKAIEEINSAQFIGPPVRRYASTVLYVCVRICPSLTNRSSIKTSGRIKLVFDTWAALDLFCTVL